MATANASAFSTRTEPGHGRHVNMRDPWQVCDPWSASAARPSQLPPKDVPPAHLCIRIAPNEASGPGLQKVATCTTTTGIDVGSGGSSSSFACRVGRCNVRDGQPSRQTNASIRGKNTDSFDPASTFVRPAMRVIAGPPGQKYTRSLKHDDVIIIPEFFCRADDWSIYNQLVEEIRQQQEQGTHSAEWIPWHAGCHMITKNPTGSSTFNSVVERVSLYFDLEPESIATRLNWYQDSRDWKPFHHDSAAFNPTRAETQNITVGVSFGAERELAFLHVDHRSLVYFPQGNGMLFSFGRDVNIRWKHGINALPVSEQKQEGRISIIVWGRLRYVMQEMGSPAMLNQDTQPTSGQSPRCLMQADEAREVVPNSTSPKEVRRGRTSHLAELWCSALKLARKWIASGCPGALLRCLRSFIDSRYSYLKLLVAVVVAFARSRLRSFAHADHNVGSAGAAKPCRPGASRQAPRAADGLQSNHSCSTRANDARECTFRDAGRNAKSGSLKIQPGPNHCSVADGQEVASSGQQAGVFEVFCKCSREEYISKHIDFGFQDLVRRLFLSDTELFRLGQKHFQDQAHHLRRLRHMDQKDDDIVKLTGTKVSNRDRRPQRETEDRGLWLDDEESEVAPFWWRSEIETLCFDLPMCAEKELTDVVPSSGQWWDVEKLAESNYFVAVSKPAGMFVVTDQGRLWDESPTSFIHVAHRRFEMPSRDEPRQRGICHRLDSHTSGVQIFGKSWEAFRHFTVQNSAHRMQKEYIALVTGRLGPPEGPDVGLIDVPMKKWQDFSRREFGSVICVNEGLPAVTKYKVLRQLWVPATGKTEFWGKGRWFTLVQLRILTGRTHQIRVHMTFIGHPLVGDVKYNPSCVEQDAAIVPRIFLHCLRMEFEDMDGSTFVAASDLSADLQVSLGRLQALAESVGAGMGGQTKAGFPGLGGLLEPGKWAAPEDFLASEPDSVGATAWPKVIIHQCKNCKELEEARCVLVRRGKRTALNWKVTRHKDVETNEELVGGQQECHDSAEVTWGPGLLWVPSELKQHRLPDGGDASDLENAGPDELGARWAVHGSEWAWAHDGTTQNGWVQLQKGGVLSSKWGRGDWRLLDGLEAPLLLVTFKGVEHALRLTDVGFDMVSRRRLAFQCSLAVDMQRDSLGPDALACCPTRGWPSPCPKMGR